MISGNDSDSSLPEFVRSCKALEQLDTPRVEMCADNPASRCIDEVPVIDVARVREICAVDPVPPSAVATTIALYQQHEREQSLFMPRRSKHLESVRVVELLVLAHEPPQRGNSQAEELVSRSIISGRRLEKALQMNRVGGIGQRVELLSQRFQRRSARRSWRSGRTTLVSGLFARSPNHLRLPLRPRAEAARGQGSIRGRRCPCSAGW